MRRGADTSPTFGAYIRGHREASGITLNHFAPSIGLSPAYWSRIERDQENPPRDDVLASAAAALNLNPDDVFVHAGRLPPDVREHLGEIVKMWRRKERRRALP